MEPSESTKQAAHEIMLYAERCRPGRMNQFTVEEIIQRAMNPDPATNPTPETPTPDIVQRCAKSICESFRIILSENGVEWNPAHSLTIIEEWIQKCITTESADLERALAEAKRRVAELDGVLRASEETRDRQKTEIERLKADKEQKPRRRYEVELKVGGDTLEDAIDLASEFLESALDGGTGCVHGGSSAGGHYRASVDESVTHESYFTAIDAARTTQEGQG